MKPKDALYLLVFSEETDIPPECRDAWWRFQARTLTALKAACGECGERMPMPEGMKDLIWSIHGKAFAREQSRGGAWLARFLSREERT